MKEGVVVYFAFFHGNSGSSPKNTPTPRGGMRFSCHGGMLKLCRSRHCSLLVLLNCKFPIAVAFVTVEFESIY